MAIQSFQDAQANDFEPMYFVTNTGKVYEGFFSNIRIDRETLPEGWHAYDIREDDETGAFGELNHGYVVVNHAGTFTIQGEIEELREKGSWVNLRVDPELHSDAVNYPDDWEYSFGSPSITR